jgi:hypothetical protein
VSTNKAGEKTTEHIQTKYRNKAIYIIIIIIPLTQVKVIINPLQNEFILNNTYKSSSYLTENTLSPLQRPTG